MYLAPYGVGLGHASRLVMVANKLIEDATEVRFSSFGEAANYVTMHGYQCAMVSPVEFAWSMEGGFSVKNSLANIPVWFTNLSRQVNQEIRNMCSTNPDIVVSDSRLSPILAARILGIPSIVVLNQVKLLLSPRLREFAISRLFENMVGEVLGSLWSLADRVLVPDLPPPNTISAHNVWGTGSAGSVLEYVGFTAPSVAANSVETEKIAKSLGIDGSMPLVFMHVSGPMQTRMPLVRVCMEAIKLLQGTQFIISEGKAGGDPAPKRIGSNGWYYQWCPVRDEIFSMCDVAVLRGGHVTLSQAILFGKPVVTVPIENHGEQLGNSIKVEEMGFGKMVHPKNLGGQMLADAITTVLSDPSYAAKARDLRLVAQSMDGTDNIVNIIESYV